MIPALLDEQIVDLYQKIDEINRRARNRKRKGAVAEIGTGENAGKYRVRLSDQGGKPFLTNWIKGRVLGAGSVKIDVVRKVGEQVDVVSESGDMTDAEIDLSTYSDENARENGDNVPMHIKIGETVIAASGDGVTITAGNIKLVGDVEIEGGSLTHNGVNVGDDHRHKDVMTGPAVTGPPEG